MHVRRRSADSIQFGLDATRSGIIETQDPEALQLALAAAEEPLTAGMLRMELAQISGMDGDSARALIDDLLDYCILVEPHRHRIVLLGHSVLAGEIARIVSECGVSVATTTADDETDALVVVVDQLARAAELSARLREHGGWVLPAVSADSRVVVGPLHRADAGPCLMCLELHLLDRDARIHAVAAAIPAGPPDLDPIVAAAGAAATTVLIRRLLGLPDPPGIAASIPAAGHTVVVDPYGPEWMHSRTMAKHPRCPQCFGG